MVVSIGVHIAENDISDALFDFALFSSCTNETRNFVHAAN